MSSRSTRPAHRSPAWCSSRGTSARKTTNELQPVIQQRARIRSPARASAAFQLPPLPGSQGLPVQFVMTTTDPFDAAQHRRAEFPAGSGQERHVHLSRHGSQDRQAAVDRCEIDRNKAAQLGLKMSDVGSALAAHAGRRLRQLFQPRPALLQGDPAGPAALPAEHPAIAQLLHRHVNGVPVPLSTIARITTKTIPNRSTTFSSSTAPPSRASRRPAWRRPTR